MLKRYLISQCLLSGDVILHRVNGLWAVFLLAVGRKSCLQRAFSCRIPQPEDVLVGLLLDRAPHLSNASSLGSDCRQISHLS